MKKIVITISLILICAFVGVSSVSASTVEPIERVNFENAKESSEMKPEYLPALAAIGQAARVAEAGVKAAGQVAKWGSAAFGAGFLGAAGADAYKKATGSSSNSEYVPEDAEVLFD
ncbi:hypothetical protein EFK13_05150 [Bacillus cabrialesii]|uniref:hypothetical protein n=1 Tax=Bacillus cabrialesii TaxID=2487276 RepID=UPI001010DAB6|nr:hypothetical protein [Bacillus cabrialesii]UQE79983.1 hypothetical protein EFK13_05150 [Bacillus cabrialesii]